MVGWVRNLGEEATGGLKFASCIPDWLADSILLVTVANDTMPKRWPQLSLTGSVIDSSR